MHLPSEIPFGAFFQYSPRGESEISRKSRRVRDAIKNDSVIIVRPPNEKPHPVRGVDYVVEIVAKSLRRHPTFSAGLTEEHILVPMPRSAPLKNKDALWPGKRICDALVAAKLGAVVLPLLERHTAVQKSATAPPGMRPDAPDHYHSVRVNPRLDVPLNAKITVVDDFVTRGATFLGVYPHLSRALPNAEIFCFALVRTISSGEVDTIVSPVIGRIENRHGRAHREP